MKKLLVATLLLSSTASANVGSSCKMVHEYAKLVMEARQLEMPITKLMKIANGDKVAESLIKAAYNEPGYRVKENQTREIDRFANEAYLVCLEAKGE